MTEIQRRDKLLQPNDILEKMDLNWAINMNWINRMGETVFFPLIMPLSATHILHISWVCVCVCVCVCIYTLTIYIWWWWLSLCHVQFFNPMACSPPGSSVHGIFQARILEWVAISFSRESSQPRDQTWVFCIVGGFFTHWATRKAHIYMEGNARLLNIL